MNSNVRVLFDEVEKLHGMINSESRFIQFRDGQFTMMPSWVLSPAKRAIEGDLSKSAANKVLHRFATKRYHALTH